MIGWREKLFVVFELWIFRIQIAGLLMMLFRLFRLFSWFVRDCCSCCSGFAVCMVFFLGSLGGCFGANTGWVVGGLQISSVCILYIGCLLRLFPPWWG